MVSVVMINEMDTNIQHAAEEVIANLRADSLGEMALPTGAVNISGNIYYQVWSLSGQLVAYSENAVAFTSALDDDALNNMKPVFQNATIQATPLRVLTVPLMVDGNLSGWLQVGAVQTELRYTQHLLQIVFVIFRSICDHCCGDCWLAGDGANPRAFGNHGRGRHEDHPVRTISPSGFRSPRAGMMKSARLC